MKIIAYFSFEKRTKNKSITSITLLSASISGHQNSDSATGSTRSHSQTYRKAGLEASIFDLATVTRPSLIPQQARSTCSRCINLYYWKTPKVQVKQEESLVSRKQKCGPAGSSPAAGRGILERLSALRNDLKPTGQQVVDYILLQPEAVLHMSVTELAKATGTSQTSVVRTCQRIGVKGFRDLKLALAHDLVGPITPIHEDLSSNDDSATVIEKIFHSNIQTLASTVKLLDSEVLQQVDGKQRAGSQSSSLNCWSSSKVS